MSKYILPTSLKELRFHLSQNGDASKPLKQFLTANYPGLKSQLKYQVPILVREAYGISPSIIARFEKGKEVRSNLEGLDEKGIDSAFKTLLKD